MLIARLAPAMLAGVVSVTACAPSGPGDAEPETITLGPVDGHDLPGVDLDRVQVGEPAPDFTLTSLADGPVTLSSFRGSSNVVLVFYRGHW